MRTAIDQAMELGEVIAWLRAWEVSDGDVKREARARCLRILTETWTALLEGRPRAKRTSLPPTQLAVQLSRVRTLLETWETLSAEQHAQQATVIKDVLSRVIFYFT